MHPVLMFATGLVAGIVGVRLIKQANTAQAVQGLGDKTRKGMEQARSGLRQATVDGLSAVEKASASLRGKLDVAAEQTPAAAAGDDAPATGGTAP